MTPEAKVTKEVLKAFSKLPHVHLSRFVAGAARMASGFFAVVVPRGFPDLAGWVVVRGVACFLGVEVKSKKGKMAAEQTQWRERIQQAGGCHIVAKSAEQAIDELEAYIRDTEERMNDERMG